MELYDLADYKSFENSLKITSKRSDRKFLITQGNSQANDRERCSAVGYEKKKGLGKTERIEKRHEECASRWETPSVELAVASTLNRETRQRRCVERKKSGSRIRGGKGDNDHVLLRTCTDCRPLANKPARISRQNEIQHSDGNAPDRLIRIRIDGAA